MSYDLDALVGDLRAALADGESEGALSAARDAVERALADPAFLETHILSKSGPERSIIHEDPELGFCVCVHIYNGARDGEPHDHGPTWAIYGQAEGETEMSDWRVVTPAAGRAPAVVEEVRRYKLAPGDAHVYPTGAVHAPLRKGSTKLLRIEGRNTDTVRRTPMTMA
jgi:hypothetical protein